MTGRTHMADNTSETPQGTPSQDATGKPLRLIRGDASPEELAALITVLAIASRDGDGDPDQSHRSALTTGRHAQSQWNLPGRMVRGSHAHGPEGWRTSALPH